MSKGVWVFVEQAMSELKEESLMLICEARKLADKLEEELAAVRERGGKLAGGDGVLFNDR